MIRLLRGRGGGVSTSTGRVVHWSRIQLRGKSRAASDPAGVPNDQKSYKRVSKEERRAMVVSYVNKYRESHEGKYPLLTDIQRDVGGSFYVIRSIFQELQYKSRMPPSTVVKETNLQADVKKDAGSLIECESLSTVVTPVKAQTQILLRGDSINESKGGDSKDKLVEATFEEIGTDQMKGHEADLGAASSNLEADEKVANDKNKHKELSYKDVNVSQTNEVSDPSGSKQGSHLFLKKPEDAGKKVRIDDSHSVASKSHLQESGMDRVSQADEKKGHDQKQNGKDFSHPDGDAKNHNAGLGDDDEHQSKSTLWSNLKSFAGGIINLWRKL